MSLGDDPTAARLDRFEELLRDPGVARGLVAKGDADRLRERHIEDALRAVEVIPGSARSLVDLGSGGGLPGIPLAIARPHLRVVLAERRRNRADFLRLVVEELELANVSIHPADATSLPHRSFDVAAARAFGDPARSWATAEPLLADDGRLVYWAGRSFDVAAGPPPGARISLFTRAAVAGSGPLVIMTRQ